MPPVPVLRVSPALAPPTARTLIVPDSAAPPPPAEGSPEWWRDRLFAKINDKLAPIRRCRAYYDGAHDLSFATPKFHEAFGGQFAEFADNWCPLIVDSAAQRLAVQGFRFGGGEDADTDAWSMWQRNALDAESLLLHHEAVKVGEGYALVSPGPDPEWPRITVEDPAHCEVELDPADRRRRLAGLKCWRDPASSKIYATLYLPATIHRWEARITANAADIRWAPRDDATSNGTPATNPVGVVPLVPFLNAPGLYGGRSDLLNVIPLINAVNKLCLDMMVAAEFGAYRQRVFAGIGEVRDKDGKPVQNFEEVVGQSRVITIPDPKVSVHDLAASELSNYTQAIESLLQHIAAITSTPPPYMLTGSGPLPASGEALKVAEAGLIAKVRRKMVDFGESWEEVARLAFRLRGDETRGGDFACETVWVDPESRTEAQRVDSLVKLKELGIPTRALWKRIPWATEGEVARWTRIANEDTMAAALADPFSPPTPPAPVPPPAPAGG